MVVRRRFIAKFGREVLIGDDHPLAVAQDALDAVQDASDSASDSASTQDSATPPRRGRKAKTAAPETGP